MQNTTESYTSHILVSLYFVSEFPTIPIVLPFYSNFINRNFYVL